MKVTINERDYELKELTKEEARAYIGKEVYVWDRSTCNLAKRKLLEVYEPYCDYPFCVLGSRGVNTYEFDCCAPVPEEWYVYETPDGNFFHSNEYQDNKKVDHGSHDYCVYKARELNEQKETTEHPLTYYELAQLLKCLGVEHYYSREVVHNILSYGAIATNKALSDGYKIRYKRGEWMSATRETVWKWWGEEVPNSDIARFVSFIGWDTSGEMASN